MTEKDHDPVESVVHGVEGVVHAGEGLHTVYHLGETGAKTPRCRWPRGCWDGSGEGAGHNGVLGHRGRGRGARLRDLRLGGGQGRVRAR